MNVISAQLSVYALDGRDLAPIIADVEKELASHGLSYQVGAMSTVLWGDSSAVFAALETLFLHMAQKGASVMNLTVSNCCPLPGSES